MISNNPKLDTTTNLTYFECRKDIKNLLKLINVSLENNSQTFFLALYYMDSVFTNKNFLEIYNKFYSPENQKNPSNKEYLMFSLACLIIATKYNENDPHVPNIIGFTNLCSFHSNSLYNFKVEELFETEVFILKLLEYKLNYYTLYHYIVFFFVHGLFFINDKKFEQNITQKTLENIYIRLRGILDNFLDDEKNIEYSIGNNNYLTAIQIITFVLKNELKSDNSETNNIFNTYYDIDKEYSNDIINNKINEIYENIKQKEEDKKNNETINIMPSNSGPNINKNDNNKLISTNNCRYDQLNKNKNNKKLNNNNYLNKLYFKTYYYFPNDPSQKLKSDIANKNKILKNANCFDNYTEFYKNRTNKKNQNSCKLLEYNNKNRSIYKNVFNNNTNKNYNIFNDVKNNSKLDKIFSNLHYCYFNNSKNVRKNISNLEAKNSKSYYSRNLSLKNIFPSKIDSETKYSKNESMDYGDLVCDNIIEKTKKVFDKTNNKSNSMEKNLNYNKIDKIDKIKTGIININLINHSENNNINLFVNCQNPTKNIFSLNKKPNEIDSNKNYTYLGYLNTKVANNSAEKYVNKNLKNFHFDNINNLGTFFDYSKRKRYENIDSSANDFKIRILLNKYGKFPRTKKY